MGLNGEDAGPWGPGGHLSVLTHILCMRRKVAECVQLLFPARCDPN